MATLLGWMRRECGRMAPWNQTTAPVLSRVRKLTLPILEGQLNEPDIACANKVWAHLGVEMARYKEKNNWNFVEKALRPQVRKKLEAIFDKAAFFVDGSVADPARDKFRKADLLAWGACLLAEAAANAAVPDAEFEEALRLLAVVEPEGDEAVDDAAAANATDMAVEPVPVEALLYLAQIKAEFRDEPETYNEFLEIVKSFRSQQIDMPALIRRVSTLFVGHGKLIDGFSTFLPKAYGGIEGTDDVLPPASRLRARTATEDIFGEPDSDEGDDGAAAEQPAKRRKESPPGWARVSL